MGLDLLNAQLDLVIPEKAQWNNEHLTILILDKKFVSMECQKLKASKWLVVKIARQASQKSRWAWILCRQHPKDHMGPGFRAADIPIGLGFCATEADSGLIPLTNSSYWGKVFSESFSKNSKKSQKKREKRKKINQKIKYQKTNQFSSRHARV